MINARLSTLSREALEPLLYEAQVGFIAEQTEVTLLESRADD